jgi:hypothetical protein
MGSSSSKPVNQNVTQTNIPKEFMPYFKRMMGRAEAQSLEPYQAYGGQRIAESGNFADINASRAMTRDIAGQGIAGLSDAQAAARANISRAAELGNYDTGNFSQYGGFQAGSATPFSGFRAGQANPYAGFSAGSATPFADFKAGTATPFADFKAGKASEFDFGNARQFTGEEVDKYMSPYMTKVVDFQKDRAAEDFDRMRGDRNTRAAQAGAFGGSRQAVQEGLAEENLAKQMQGLDATGRQSAYEQAAQRFESDRAAQFGTQQAQAYEAARAQGINIGEMSRVQQARAAELARTQGINIGESARVQQARAEELARTQGISIAEAARIQASQAGELARTQGINIGESARVQQARAAELARTQGISIAEATRIQASEAAELARTQGINIGESARVQEARAEELARTQGISIAEAARIQAAQAADLGRVQTGTEASRQFGASQGLAALQASGAAANQLVGYGQQGRAADIQNAQMLEAIGRARQQESQAGLDIRYQDFLRQQGYPQEQLGFYSDVLRGLPLAAAGTQTSTNYQYSNPLQQYLGAGLSGLSLYQAYS